MEGGEEKSAAKRRRRKEKGVDAAKRKEEEEWKRKRDARRRRETPPPEERLSRSRGQRGIKKADSARAENRTAHCYHARMRSMIRIAQQRTVMSVCPRDEISVYPPLGQSCIGHTPSH